LAQSLEDLYQQEIGDLISANEQMRRVVDSMVNKAQEQKFKQLLSNSVTAINEHTQTLRGLHKGTQQTECKAMAGLIEETQRHAIDANLPEQLRDVAMIAHYQRMSHYGIAGFGTAAAYAKALGHSGDAQKLSQIVSDIYRADEYTSQLAEAAERAAAKK
jgi:ferritin-like metal-binding protein YciE